MLAVNYHFTTRDYGDYAAQGLLHAGLLHAPPISRGWATAKLSNDVGSPRQDYYNVKLKG